MLRDTKKIQTEILLFQQKNLQALEEIAEGCEITENVFRKIRGIQVDHSIEIKDEAIQLNKLAKYLEIPIQNLLQDDVLLLDSSTFSLSLNEQMFAELDPADKNPSAKLISANASQLATPNSFIEQTIPVPSSLENRQSETLTKTMLPLSTGNSAHLLPIAEQEDLDPPIIEILPQYAGKELVPFLKETSNSLPPNKAKLQKQTHINYKSQEKTFPIFRVSLLGIIFVFVGIGVMLWQDLQQIGIAQVEERLITSTKPVENSPPALTSSEMVSVDSEPLTKAEETSPENGASSSRLSANHQAQIQENQKQREISVSSSTSSVAVIEPSPSLNSSSPTNASVPAQRQDSLHPTIQYFRLDEGHNYTRSTQIPFRFQARDNQLITAYYVADKGKEPSLRSSRWQPIAETQQGQEIQGKYQLTIKEPTSYSGEKVLFLWVRDAAGNISSYQTKSLLMDFQNPQILEFVLNKGKEASNSRLIKFQFLAQDNIQVSAYHLSQVNQASPIDKDWRTIEDAQKTVTIQGEYTLEAIKSSNPVYLWVRDTAGNISKMQQQSMVIDTTGPQVTKFELNDGELIAQSSIVNFHFTAQDVTPITAYYIAQQEQAPTKQSAWFSVSHPSKKIQISDTYALQISDWKKPSQNLYLWLQDSLGNISLRYQASLIVMRPKTDKSIIKDTKAPEFSSFSLKLNHSNSESESMTVCFTAKDNVAVSAYYLSGKETPPKNAYGIGWEPLPQRKTVRLVLTVPLERSVAQNSAPARQPIHVWVRDAAGHVSAQQTAVVDLHSATVFPAESSGEC